MGFLDKYSKKEVQEIIANSVNFADALIKMGRSANSGSNRMVIAQYVKDNQINIAHFENEVLVRTPKNIFIQNSTATQSTVRKYYRKGNYSDYKCAICGIDPIWNGKELVLTLDHINGVSNDHRLDNLRWICPNCDRQLPTYGSKRLKKDHLCSVCGKTINRKTKTGMCKDCYAENVLKNHDSEFNRRKIKHGNYTGTRSNGNCIICGAKISKSAKYCVACYAKTKMKSERPPMLDLARMIKESSFTAVGKKFGVSDRAVHKWCQDYDIPHTRKELVDWYNKQMGIIPEPKRTKTPIDEIVRPIHQIDKTTGEILNTFACQADALRHLGKTTYSNHISQVCRGIRKSAYGYYWEYAD